VFKWQETYWLKEFTGDIPVLQLPIDYQRPSIQSFEGDTIRFALEKEVSHRLKRLARQEDVTLYMVLLAVVNVLLFKLSTQEDIIIGTPVVGRRHADLEGIIGMFVNTLTLRNYPRGEKTFAGFLKEIREKTMKAFENQEYPFEELVERVAVNRDMSRNPLFDVMFALHNQSTLPPEMLNVMKKGRYGNIPFRPNRSKFDLSLHAIEAGEILGVSIEYSTKLFKKETIQRFIRYFRAIIASISGNHYRKLSDIYILSKEEKEQLLVEFNRTDAQYPRYQTLHQLFKEQVEKTPDHIAVVGTHCLHESTLLEGTRGLASLKAPVAITYRELNHRSNQLAYLLGNKGAGPDTIVGIMVERSLEMISGILGILKAGGAYMPIDPGYPEERVRYMLADSGAKILVTTPGLSEEFNRLSIVNCQLLIVNEMLTNRRRLNNPPKEATNNLQLECFNLAYILYTSGSTGRPKGVMVQHRAVMNTLYTLSREYPLQETDVYLLKTSFLFDVSVTELFGWFWRGGRLAVLEKGGEIESQRLLQTIQRYGVTHINFVPSMFTVFTDYLGPRNIDRLSSLRYIFLAGEELLSPPVERFRELAPGIALENIYGPTETAIYASRYSLRDWQGAKELKGKEKNSESKPKIPIGKPLANIKLYILDKYHRLKPMGTAGELCISGAGLAVGYLNNPGLTVQSFGFYRSYMSYKSYILYKTGDLARWLSDGNIEYLGRIDQQVKIRGYRIEPGEIEKQLLTYEQQKIKAAVVIPREDRDKDRYLCGYLVAEHGIDISNLKEYLTRTLPDYMIPPFFVQLEEIPLTTSGKVDKRALPEPDKVKREDSFIEPENEVEQELALLWSTVLGIEAAKIGTLDNFFELGGHSLKATQLAAQIHKTFNIKVPLPEFFKSPTIKGIAHYLQQAAEERFAVIEKAEPREYYPLSSAQKRLYVLQQMEEESTVYNMPLVIPMTGEIDKEKLEQIFRKLIARHESLRTSFHMVNEEPAQKIHDHVDFEIEYYDLQVKGAGDRCRWKDEGTRGLAPLPIEPATRNPQPVTALISSFIRPFDLSRAPLLRVGLIALPHTPTALRGHPSQEGKEHKYILMVDMHHIISDGLSLEILSHEFTALYNGRQVPELHIRYKDYALWQHRRKIRESTRKQEAYWLKVLGDDIPVLRLPYDFPRPGIQDFAGGKMDFEIGQQETIGLKQLALAREATLYMVLLAAFTLLMSKLSGQEDIIIGTPTAGRQHADLEGVIGMFVNTLVMRNRPFAEQTFNAFLNEVKINTLEAFENQDYQFEDLVEKAAVNRDAGRNPLFDVMFTMQHMDVLMQKSLSSVEKTIPYPFETRVSKFDLILECTDAGETLYCLVEYGNRLFKPETIQRFIAYFKIIISALLSSPNKPIAEIEILTEEERHQILYVFNDTAVDSPKDKTILQCFEEQVEQTPANIAMFGPLPIKNRTYMTYTTHITYWELNQKSNQLAGLLIEQGVQTDTIVGIMVERSVEMIIGILAILKADSAYMPIDPEYPGERIKYMLKDSGAKILVTTPGLSEEFKKLSIVNCQLLIVNDSSTNRQRLNNPPKEANSINNYQLTINNLQLDRTNLAYILYTSGSTGRPNGVAVEHRSLVNLCNWHNRYFEVGPADHAAQYASLGFDASVWEIFPYLSAGATLHIIEEHIKTDIYQLESYFQKHGITIGFLPTPTAEQFMPLPHQGSKRQLRVLLTGGDKLHTFIKQSYHLYNNYGPTENTVVTTSGLVKDKVENIPIGKPIHNNQVYILKPNSSCLQPIGVPGELCIAGDSLARGYLNNPELTAERFLPITPLPHNPIYLTGDRGRWLPDGNIEFLGRIDSQIKIRGFRIESGEIENQLLKYKDITSAVVIAREVEVGDKHLCAYIVSDKEISILQLKEYLSHSLPYYMIPSYVIQVEKIPLTTHGKVNRQALPEPHLEKPTAFVAPRDWWEEQIAVLWAEVLGVAKEMLSIDTNFFEIGGQSLKATILSTKIHKTLEVKIPLVEIFKTSTIRGLAGYIKKAAPNQGYTAIEPSESKEYYPLSPTQKGIYILQRLDPASTAYHIPFFMEIKGAVDKQRFEEAFRALIKRHGSLRTSFDIVNGEPVQKVHDKVEFEIEYYDLKVAGALIHGDRRRGDNEGTGGLAPLSVEPFDLAVPPLFRVGMIRLQEKKHVLMVDIHHIVSDGTSINILVGDFMALYQGTELPLPAVQYKDYSQWQNSRRWQEIIARQEKVWLREFNGELPLLNLPLDFSRPPVQEFAGSALAFELSPQETQAVKNFVLNQKVTIYMMVLSVFTVLMAKLSGQDDIIIGTPAAGRNHEDLQSIVGMFVNTLALRNFPLYYKTFKEFLHTVKEKTLNAFENQDYPFEELVVQLGSEIPRDRGRNPLFDVMVTPQDIEVTTVEIPGLKLGPHTGKKNGLQTTKFDLTLMEAETPEQLVFTLSYRTRLFKEETIRRFINYFKKIFAAVVENPQKRIGEIETITEKERQQILKEFNDTTVEYPEDKTLDQLFAEQTARTPDHIALAGTHQTHKKHEKEYNMSYLSYMSYKELNKKSNQLAHLLQEKGVKPNTIVGIMVERSIEMIIGLFGILKAGAAYLPIDPEYPEERIQYMLKDSSARILLKKSEIRNPKSETNSNDPNSNDQNKGAEVTVLDFEHLNFEFRASNFVPSNLAYIIYTSGSTGKPKGVLIDHRSAVNVVTWFVKHYHLDCHTRVLQLSSYTFDASVNQIFGALSHGAGLYLVSKELLNNIEKLRMYIEANDINMVYYVPLFLKELLLEHSRIKSIKIVISGGDLLEKTIKDRFIQKGYTLYNQYGPTETTVNVFAGQCVEGKVALGRPIYNTVCLILDKAGHLCPVGITGELCLAGAGVSRGYLNQPERTAEKFCLRRPGGALFEKTAPPGPPRKNFSLKFSDKGLMQSCNHASMHPCNHAAMQLSPHYSPHYPITPLPQSPIYRTGDLARWLSDGRVEFLGRRDHQVKIRGFRVELGEIESHLHRINGVKNAVVIARQGQTNEKYLCAYIAAEETISASHLEDELGKHLPAYMIPAFFVQLEGIPVTVNGKLDRKALPEPDSQSQKNKSTAPPRNHIEKKLAEIWMQVLFGSDIKEVSLGIDDNFFELGGNSLKSIRLISQIYKIFNVEVPMSLIFKTPFIRNMAAHLMRDKFRTGEEEIVISLNPEKNGGKKIFCFPPAVGYGIAYMQLAPLFNGNSLYAFNYIDGDNKNKDKMERYLEAIREIQPQGPYTLLGYSAGGRLCIKAAELLEKQGKQVKDIILLDCYSRRKSRPEEVVRERTREFNHQLKQGLKELGLESMTGKVMETMEKYAQYTETLQEMEPQVLLTDIHLIKAKDKQDREGFIGWEAFTRGKYHEYKGFGIHREMLSPGFIEQNAAVINNILTSTPANQKLLRGVQGGGFLEKSLPGRRRQEQANEILSACNKKFLEFVERNPGALIGSNYRDLIEKLGGDILQPWPTFLDQPARKIMEKTALTTINLIRSIPKRIFNHDPYEMSRYYRLPARMIETQLNGVTDEFLETLIGRGDFALTSSGYKCLEFNIAGNIGGLHLPIWAVPYFENPIILRFLKENHIKIIDQDAIDIFLEHLVSTAGETLTITDSRLNIAMVARKKGAAPGESNEPGKIEIALNRRYEKTLSQLDRKLQGRVILCDFDDLTVRGDGLYHKDQPVHVLVESYEGAVPPEILHLFKTRRICLFNGPVTGLMSNKLNLALLSEHEDSPLFNETEREAIKTYIPWTRKIIASETLYKGDKIQLVDFIRQNREQLVMKPGVGYGGEGVAVGKYISQTQWETVLQTALQKGKWLVQEYMPSLPLLYQYGENGAEPHIGVVGFLVFGNRFAREAIRMLPCSKRSGVINFHQGARVSILFEVET
jgi:tyrocidine synthetase-3